jgi:hypothetical protein
MIDISIIEKILLKIGREARLTDVEENTLREWCAESEDNQKLADIFRNRNELRIRLEEMKNIPSKEMWQTVQKRTRIDKIIAANKELRKKRLIRYILLGILLSAMLVGYYCRLVHFRFGE